MEDKTIQDGVKSDRGKKRRERIGTRWLRIEKHGRKLFGMPILTKSCNA
jgi:hypothetical protein